MTLQEIPPLTPEHKSTLVKTSLFLTPYGSFNSGLMSHLNLIVVLPDLETHVEGTILYLLTPKDANLSTKYVFKKYLFIFMKYIEFISFMASFSSRTYGPHWFKIKFSTLSPGNQFEVVNIWVDFFKPTILSTRISIGKVGLGHVGNQPNWVARLFGFSQFLPRSLFTKDVEICLATTTLTKKVYKACLDFHAKNIINLSPFKFEAFFHCTKEFEEWWTRYHNSVVVDYSTLLQHLTNFFTQQLWQCL